MKFTRSGNRPSASLFSFAMGRAPRRRRTGFGPRRVAAVLAVTEVLEDRAMLSAHALDETPLVFDYNGVEVKAYVNDEVAQDLGGAQVAGAGLPSGVPPFPLTDTFKLHSLPGANYTIYLDFNGHTTAGTVWNQQFNNGNAVVSPGYDVDGNPTSFSAIEQEMIQRTWRRVAEDFAPFDVDVTTEDPGVEALRKTFGVDTKWGVRAVVTADDAWLRDDGVISGGIAYLGSFSWDTDTPVFIFNGATSTGTRAEMVMADTFSHEVGHSLGLSHDGRTTPAEGYYGGHGNPADPTSWAPIMGAFFADGTDNQLTQWSKGEYANANNTEDDLAIITDPTKNGAGFGWSGLSYLGDLIADEDFATPVIESTALTLTGGLLGGQGLIERTGDVDSWTFNWGGGLFTIDIKPAEEGANLDILAELLDATGAVVATSNPLNGLDALFQDVALAVGRYFIRVKGTGKAANGSDLGYTNYASLGMYTIGFVPGVSDDAYEENDLRTAAADPLGNGGEWSNRTLSSINGPGKSRDADYYLINVTSDFSRLTAQLSFTNTQGNLDLYLYDTRGNLLAASTQIRADFESLDVIVPAAGQYVLLVAANGPARGSSYDLWWDDVPVAKPRVSVSLATTAVTEDGAPNLVYTFTRTAGGIGESLTVDFLVSGTARYLTDYFVSGATSFSTTFGQVTFAAGSTSAQVTVNPITDNTIEPDETVILTVTESSAFGPYRVGEVPAAIGTILNDDPRNFPPVANTDNAATTEDASVVIGVLGNDTDANGDALRVLSVDSTGLAGTVQINPNGTLTYNPGTAFQNLAAGASVIETFTYVVTDDKGGTATGTVKVTVNGLNDAPIARADDEEIRADRVLNGNVLTNDSDIDGGPLAVSAVNGVAGNVGRQITLASGAKVTVNADGTYAFDPAGVFDDLTTGESAVVTFSYTVSDGAGGTATATATITITTANDSPAAVNDATRINERGIASGNVLTNDTDLDGDTLVVAAVNGVAARVGQLVTLASGARVRVNADGTYTYDPNGAFVRLRRGESATDSFTYAVSDGHGGIATATVTVTIDGGGGEADVVGFNHGIWQVGLSDGTSFVTSEWARWADVDWQNLLQGDFNGDGRTDVAGQIAGFWFVGVSTGNSFDTAARAWGKWEGTGWRDVLVGDVNGDGKDDIFGRAANGQWWVSRSTGGAFENKLFGFWAPEANWLDARVGDFDGDGKSDVAGRTAAGFWWISRSTGAGSQNFKFAFWNDAAWRDVRVLDVNGDGKDDIAGRTASGQWWVSRSRGAGIPAQNILFASWTEALRWRDVRVLDVNGDGKDDIAGRTAGGQWFVSRSDGSVGTTAVFGAWVESDGWRDVVAGDFDGDGRDDIAGRANNGAWSVLRSTGVGSEVKAFGNWSGATNFRAVAAVDAGTVPIAVPGAGAGAAKSFALQAAAIAPVTKEEQALSLFWSRPDDELEAGLLARR